VTSRPSVPLFCLSNPSALTHPDSSTLFAIGFTSP
jgi:hypothetical protein